MEPTKTVKVCPLMQEYRDLLDVNGIEWRDQSEEYGEGGISFHIERTKTGEGESECSVIWGYTKINSVFSGKSKTYNISYGYPDFLECWHEPTNPDPVPMTPVEILQEIYGIG